MNSELYISYQSHFSNNACWNTLFYALQNDFSYYRRTTQRLRNSQNQNSNEEPSSELESIPMNTCNSMSLFFANATPMLQVLM